MIEYTHLDIERLIPLGNQVRISEQTDSLDGPVWHFIEGIVLEHANIEEFDDTIMDWPEEAECSNIIWVQPFDFTGLWWFDTEQSEVLIDGAWYSFEDIVTGRKMIGGGK